MIKTLLNADEEPPPGTKVIVEETIIDPPAAPQIAEPAEVEQPAETVETRETLENSGAPEFFANSSATSDEPAPPDEDPVIFTNAFAEPLNDEPEIIKPSAPAAENLPLDAESESEAALIAALENLEAEDRDFLEREREPAPPVAETVSEPFAEPEIPRTEPDKTAERAFESATGTIFQTEYTPPTTGETIRQSGLAWTAGVVLFASVVFMMIFGWFADLLFGSSPWGLVGGVILGGIIGFIQLFRITSQIFKK
jgi:F0F1-type ATP synthase assembly protein I